MMSLDSRPAPAFKRVAARTALAFAPVAPGLTGVNIMAGEHAIEPFLVFTEFRMDRPVFGPHPHAGVSVMTYILPDSDGGFLNRDSDGDRSDIHPGAVHVTQAGRGIHHDEVPLVTGVEAHGFQIWINHREEDRWVEPRAMHAAADEIPQLPGEGRLIRLLHGEYGGHATPYRMVTDVTLLHVKLWPGATVTLSAAEMAFAYGVRGQAWCDGASLGEQVLLVYGADGAMCRLEAGPDGAEFLFATASPLRESIVYGGPFVTTTASQMIEAQRRYARGEMGQLRPERFEEAPGEP